MSGALTAVLTAIQKNRVHMSTCIAGDCTRWETQPIFVWVAQTQQTTRISKAHSLGPLALS